MAVPPKYMRVHECERTRLFEGGIATIDVSACGTLQLHLGVITLRMTPGTAAEFQASISRALTRLAALQNEARTKEPGGLVSRGGDA